MKLLVTRKKNQPPPQVKVYKLPHSMPAPPPITNPSQTGFTLMEMLIAIAIVAILTTLTIPTFSRYLKRAHYTELVNAITPFKIGVSECFQINGSLDDCSSNANGVPEDINNTSKKSLVKSIKTQKGIITATPKSSLGFTEKDTYILTPSTDNDNLIWATSGGGVDAGYTR